MKFIEFTYDLGDIDTIAKIVFDHLESKTLLFNGAMGAGKTTFINALLKAMKSNDVATSPTFSIVNEYDTQNDKIYHFDFYRIQSLEEAYNFGIEEYLSSNDWLFIEWPERLQELIPEEHQTITIAQVEDNIRSLKLTIKTNQLTENKAMTVPRF